MSISTAKPRESMVIGKEIRKYNVYVNGNKMTSKRVTYTRAKALYNRYELAGETDIAIV